MISDMNLTIFDFETSGLDPEKESVIEMAALKIQKGVVVGSFNCFVKHNKPLTPKITELTGITDDDLKDGFEEDIAFKLLKQFMGNNIITAHNASFDLQFLHFSRMRLFKQSFANSFIDTLSIARDRDIFPHKLVNLTERYGLEMDTAHRALADVYGCYYLLQKFDKDEPIEEWINKINFNCKYGAPKWSPEYSDVFGTENKYKN
jgi:DNA polymerase-3 subunit epsilon